MSRNSMKLLLLLMATCTVVWTSCPGGETSISSCENGKTDGSESDVDCGGGTCEPCELGRNCHYGSDCKSGRCKDGKCVEALSCLQVEVGAHVEAPIVKQTGAFEIEWEVTPLSENVDVAVALSLSPPAEPDWKDLATIVLFNRDNYIEVRNGDTYAADVAVSYIAGETYRIREEVDVSSHNYSVYLTPPGESEILLAQNYFFRTEQSAVTALDHVNLISDNGPLQACYAKPEFLPTPIDVEIVEVTPGSCQYPKNGMCVANSTVTAVVTGGDGSKKKYAWTVTGGMLATGQGTDTITVTSQADTDVVYTVECQVSDDTYSDVNSASFTHTRSEQGGDSHCSGYEEQASIPPYDPGNPEHLLITPSNGKWTNANLNDSPYRHFYLEPGDYSGTTITLTSDGTEDNPRTISLFNGNDTHPAALPDNQQANVSFSFDGGSHWVLDRLSFLSVPPVVLHPQSKYNVINRAHFRNFGSYAIIIESEADHNTIQNSYLDTMTESGRLSDGFAICFDYREGSSDITTGCKIINNDIRNANDGIMLFVLQSDLPAHTVYYPDTVISCNRIWVDGDIYTNGDWSDNGYDFDGQYQVAENALDIKSGSNSPDHPVVISNNILFGYRRMDPTAMEGHAIGDRLPAAITMHYGAAYVRVEGNVIYDSAHGINISDASGEAYSVGYSVIRNNIFAKTGMPNPTDSDGYYGVNLNQASDIAVVNNTFRDHGIRSGCEFFVTWNSSNITFSDNVAISALGARWGGGTTNTAADGNWYYDSTQTLGGTSDHVFAAPSEANMTSLNFMYERFTAAPKQHVVEGVVSTSSSPHYGLAGSNIEAMDR